MTFVDIVDTDGATHTVNPHKVAKLGVNSTRSTTVVVLASGKQFETATARATLQTSLTDAMELVEA